MRRWSIRREVSIKAPADVVWAYVGTPEGLREWWCPPPTVRFAFEPRQGSRFVEQYADGRFAYELEGTIVEYQPPRRFAVRRLTPGSPSPADLITITLTEEDGLTKVVVEHSFEHLPVSRRKETQEYFAEPWSNALRSLCELVTAGYEWTEPESTPPRS